MDKAALTALLVTYGPILLSVLFAALWWRAPKGEDAAVAALRKVAKAAKALTPEQRAIIEQAIAWADETFDRYVGGDEKLAAATEWAIDHRVPVNRAVVQWVYNLLKATGKKE